MTTVFANESDKEFSYTIIVYASSNLCRLQILLRREKGSSPHHLHWGKPRGLESSAGAALWRLGGSQHLLSRWVGNCSECNECSLVNPSSTTFVDQLDFMFCSQGMLASSVTKAFESVASPESSNPMTTERVCFYMLLSLKYCVLRVAGLYILETMLCFLCMLTGHHEFPPYGPDTLRSVYHIRNIEVFKLKQVALNSCTRPFICP